MMRTRASILLALALAAAAVLAPSAPAAAATTFGVDSHNSSVDFRIRHLISKVSGKFTNFTGTIVKDDANPAASSVEFDIQTASIDTGNDDRDADLRSPNFFDAKTNPEITFRSTKVEKTGDSTYNVTGPLQMHGITKVITLPVTFAGLAKDPWGKTRAVFSISTTLNRKEFAINWNKALDNGGMLLGDDVEVSIDLECPLK